MADPNPHPAARTGPDFGTPMSYGRADLEPRRGGPANLADILERVLDKGIVIAGDIQINLLEIELLTIKLRLLITSVDRAREIGVNWWEGDPSLSSSAQSLENENRQLRERVERLERAIGPGDGNGESNAEREAESNGESGGGRRSGAGGSGGEAGGSRSEPGGSRSAREPDERRTEVRRERGTGGPR